MNMPNGSKVSEIGKRGLALIHESVACRWATLAMYNRWEKESQNCVSTMVLGTEYISFSAETLVVLLAGGDKRTQNRDIRKALELAREL